MLSSAYRRAFAPRLDNEAVVQAVDPIQAVQDVAPAASHSYETPVPVGAGPGQGDGPTLSTIDSVSGTEMQSALLDSYAVFNESLMDIPSIRRPLDELPGEIIAHIASFTNVSTVLALSRTNKAIRAASYDHVLLREMLSDTATTCWGHSSFDLDHIAHVAGSSARVWARYTLAVQSSWDLRQDRRWCEREGGRNLQDFWAELLVMRCPVKANKDWLYYADETRNQPLSQLFGLCMALMSTDEMNADTVELIRNHANQPRCAGYTETFWDVCFAISTLKLLANDSKVLQLHQVPLRAKDPSVRPPLPFLRSSSMASCTEDYWETWFYKLTRSNMSPSSLSDSEWCGYIIEARRDGNNDNCTFCNSIKFRPINKQEHVMRGPNGEIKAFSLENLLKDENRLDVWAEYSDVGPVTGIVFRIHFASYPEYSEAHWNCRITPFGIVGTYGAPQPTSFLRHHSWTRPKIWLWRKDWQEK